jgi:hypothetical protein
LLVVLLAWGLCACASPIEEASAPPTGKPRVALAALRPTPTAIPTLIIPTVRPTASPTARATDTPLQSCFPPSLSSGLHLSASGSYTETEDQAAGPMLCRIERDSCAFRHLIGNLDPAILINRHKPPPYENEEILMHPAMLLPLTRLKDMVAAEWGGQVQLMITAAYDSFLEHDLTQADPSRRYSLHFEGRSLDLVTFPAEPARYARLCALARCAGFDWVHNEGDHCHVSIQAQSLCAICSGSNGR